MAKKGFIYNDVEFDDIVNDVHGKWTTICRNCVATYGFDRNIISDCAAPDEICGVKNCNNRSDYYIDFGKKPTATKSIKPKTQHINVATPSIYISSSKHFNGLVSNMSTNKVNSVAYNETDAYVIITKDAVTPDIKIDEDTVETLVRARMRKKQIEAVIAYCETTKNIKTSILYDTRTLMAIVEQLPVDAIAKDEQIAHICNTMPCVQKYIK